MKTTIIKFIIILQILFGASYFLSGQCTHSICLYDTYGDGWNGGSITVSVGGTNVVSAATLSSGSGPACFDFNVSDGEPISITYSEGSWGYENYYQIYSSSNESGNTLYDSGSGSTPPSSQTVTADCSGGSPPATDCLGALPFCTSDSYTFPASTNVSDMGSVGCLYTTPNPAWYWMEIGDPGSIDIYISSGGDVDFIAWGPFNSLTDACASNLMANSGVDCSYSTAATETANIPTAQTGEVYVLLITNYANIETNISFSQTSGAGSTNCGIIAPPITNNGPLCEGETLELSVSNPTAGATYYWSGPNEFSSTDMNPTITNVTSLNNGTYSLVITIGSETSDPVTTDVVINSNIIPTFNSYNTYCAGESIPALPTISNNGINGTWSPAINNTTTTTYSFTPSSGQCALNTELDIEVDLLESDLLYTTNQFCDAFGTAEVTGLGTPPYSYTWPNNASGVSQGQANELTAGNYTVSLSDFYGCQTTQDLTIEFTDNLNATSALISNPNCFEESNGSIQITISNGTGPYTITWDSISIESNTANYTANNLLANTYNFAITDINGCQSTTSFEITDPPLLIITENHSQIACAGETTYVTINASGGTPDYTGTGNFEVTSGTHTYTISDNNGCTATTEITIASAPDPLEITANIHNPNCFNLADGSIDIISSGGTPPFNYHWNNEYETCLVTNLIPGTYSVTVTDDNECSQSDTYSIIEPDKLDLTFTTTDLSCYNNPNGSVQMTANGGITPYTYEISKNGFNATGQNHSNLSSGNYTIKVIDTNGCINEKNINIHSPSELTVSVSTTDPSCKGNNDGIIEFHTNGGTEPYSYMFEGMIIPIKTYTGLTEGTYSGQIIDANNCINELNPIILIDNPIDCIKIPNTFTPNGDGINDTWIIENLEMFPRAYIYVYNRWGQEIWTGNYENEWDGLYNKKEIPSGSYLYIINLYNGKTPYSGTVTIIH